MPEVDFRAANFSDCLDFVQTHIDASNNGSVAPRFVCDLDTARYLFVREPHADGHNHAPLPTFKAKDISVFQVMQILGELCQIQFTTTPEVIIVQRIKETTANNASQVTSQ